ncbi:MAG TPA: hypothetical protein VFQ38_02870 [Longimicrobiales bacterium]|nr:hypothetical protein [Longimicrobiales bacterium]
MEPWEIYVGELEGRGKSVARAQWGRDERLMELAHDAYQRTSDELTARGWDEEDALTLTRIFGQEVKAWMSADTLDWSELRERLRSRWRSWESGGEPD